jgi:hypothetical protein
MLPYYFPQISRKLIQIPQPKSTHFCSLWKNMHQEIIFLSLLFLMIQQEIVSSKIRISYHHIRSHLLSYAPQPDPEMKVVHYQRTPQQLADLGFTSDEAPSDQALKTLEQTKEEEKDDFNYKQEALEFPGNCPSCSAPTKTKMVLVGMDPVFFCY